MNRNSIKKIRHKADFLMRETLTDVNESFFMEMNSDGELSFRGCRKIKDYTGEEIFLISDEYFITVKGSSLVLKSYSETATDVSGKIDNITFVERGGKTYEARKTH